MPIFTVQTASDSIRPALPIRCLVPMRVPFAERDPLGLVRDVASHAPAAHPYFCYACGLSPCGGYSSAPPLETEVEIREPVDRSPTPVRTHAIHPRSKLSQRLNLFIDLQVG
jgi:hypothetical protein